MSVGATRARGTEPDARLVARWQCDHDEAAREQLVRNHLPRARRIARSYGHAEHAEDMLQVACMGLVKAIDRFDPSRGLPLSAYATATMRGEVRRYLRDHAWGVHVPRDLQEQALKVRGAAAQLAREGEAPTAELVARRLRLPERVVAEALQAAMALAPASLDERRRSGAGDDCLHDRLGTDDGELETMLDRVLLDRLARLLPRRDRQILWLRYGEDLTQGEIGERVGLSQMQVSRRLSAILQRMTAGAVVPQDRAVA